MNHIFSQSNFRFLFISGVGSIGTFLEGPVVGWIVAQYGWSAMFTCMILLSVFGAITSFRAARYQRTIKLSLASSSSSLNQNV
jgi:MFS family permease